MIHLTRRRFSSVEGETHPLFGFEMIRNASVVTKVRKRLEKIRMVDRLEKRFFDISRKKKKLTHVRLPSCTYVLTSSVLVHFSLHMTPETEVIREKTNVSSYITTTTIKKKLKDQKEDHHRACCSKCIYFTHNLLFLLLTKIRVDHLKKRTRIIV